MVRKRRSPARLLAPGFLCLYLNELSAFSRGRSVGLADIPNGRGSYGEQYARHNEHAHCHGRSAGSLGEESEDEAATQGCDNLGHADGAVEQAEISADMVARQGVGAVSYTPLTLPTNCT